MSSSDFSSESDFDMDVDEGTAVGSVMPSIQVSEAPRIIESQVSAQSDEDSELEEPPKITVLKSEKEPSSVEISSGSSDLDSVVDTPQPKQSPPKEEMKFLAVNKKPMTIGVKDFNKTVPSPMISPITKPKPSPNMLTTQKKHLHTKSSRDFSDLNFDDDFASTQKPKGKPIDVERLYRFQAKTQAKIKELAGAQVKKDMEQCTFKPNIKTSREKRTAEEFINDMERMEKTRQNAIENLRNENLKAYGRGGLKPKPTICKKSKIMVKQHQNGKNKVPVHEKLWKDHTKKDREQLLSPIKSVKEDRRSFTPSINQKSLRLERSESIDNRLYNDALRRKRAASESPVTESVFRGRLITENSEKVLAKKFEIDFSSKLKELNIEDAINYTKFVTLLKAMSFIIGTDNDEERNTIIEIWKLLKPIENYVSIENVLNIFKGIMNYPLSEGNEELLVFDRDFLHKTFFSLSENRTNAVSFSNKNPRFKDKIKQYSFRPSLNKTSSLLAGRSRNNRSFLSGQKSNVDFLVTEQQVLQEKWEEMKKLKEKEDAKKYTFKPTINKKKPAAPSTPKNKDMLAAQYKQLSSEKDRFEALYSLAKVEKSKKEKIAKSKEDIEIEENMKECTFTPKLETQKFNNEYDQVKGVSQMINKLRKGKTEVSEENSYRKGNSLSQSRQSRLSNYEKQLTKDIGERDTYQNSESSEDEDCLTVSVNLPNGVVDTLVIYRHDNKADVIQRFIDKHSIDDSSAKKLIDGLN
ncbi:unnamed protein product [Blepharisma stoltei]|uniref:Uncharacterized protein n=1 Tax=Blepharisma stoltei TaxID=1481888 RepID=A0AAU9I9F7_9CILI|nr:unnamed protein product [Blepharisma stoltei]